MIIQFTDILYPLLYFFFVGIMITWKHNDIMTRNEVHAKNFAYLIFKFRFWWRNVYGIIISPGIRYGYNRLVCHV